MKNERKLLFGARSKWISIGASLATALILTLPQSVSAETTNTFQEEQFNVFVPCANGGLGETVAFKSVLHLTRTDGVITHGNQIQGTGVGLISGDAYVAGGSPSNLVPAGNGNYLYHLSWIGLGPDAARYVITAIGPIMAPPSEIIQVSCHS